MAMEYYVSYQYQLNDAEQSTPAHYFGSCTEPKSDFTYLCSPEQFTPQERLHMALGGEILVFIPNLGENAGKEVHKRMI